MEGALPFVVAAVLLETDGRGIEAEYGKLLAECHFLLERHSEDLLVSAPFPWEADPRTRVSEITEGRRQ